MDLKHVWYEKIKKCLRNRYYLRKLIKKIQVTPWLMNNRLYCNIYNNRIKYMIKEPLTQIPEFINIEATNACNAGCVMCTHSIMKRKAGFMDSRLFKKIIDEISYLKNSNKTSIGLNNIGEPLMDPYIIERVKYIKGRGLKVTFYTNASLLNKESSLVLINSGIDKIGFSLDAFMKRTYERIRRGLNFEITLNNILQFLTLRKKLSKNRPEVIITLIKMKENYNELRRHFIRWKSLVEDVVISDVHDWAGRIKVNGVNSPDIAPQIKRWPCRDLWENLIILYNGDVVPCCVDYDGEMILGNLSKDSLKKIWQGEKLQIMRQLHLNREFNKLPVCKNCLKHRSWW